MRRRYYGQKRRTRVWMLLLLLLMTAVFLVSCVAGNNAMWFKGLFGLDVNDYVAEAVEAELDPQGEVARPLLEMVEMVVGETVRLTGFRTASQAVSLYRERILNAMLCTNYARYTGDRAAISAVAAAYPRAVMTTLISAAEFENTVLRYFGGNAVDHQSGGSFVYLSRAAYYSAPTGARESSISVQPVSLQETQNTYRLRFTLSDGAETSTPYTAIFVKRADGSCYWKALEA